MSSQALKALSIASNATVRNWQRLSIDFEKCKLQHRANKVLSEKIIVPKELFVNSDNRFLIENIVSFVKTQNIGVKTTMNSLCLSLLKAFGVLTETFETLHSNIKEFIQELLQDYSAEICQLEVPLEERDFLGIVYQMLLTEGQKNSKGSYFTPKHIVEKLCANIKVSKNQVVLDPCCGSGAFLLGVDASDPKCLYGFDFDPITVNIAKTNIIARYSYIDFEPNIFCVDFLTLNSNLLSDNRFAGLKVDYIITNPPWGTKHFKNYNALFNDVHSKELFSYFIVKAKDFIKKTGSLWFILPDSIRNIKVHSDIRAFILKNFDISEINLLGSVFSGVLSPVISLSLTMLRKGKQALIKNGKSSYFISQESFVENTDNMFCLPNSSEKSILDKIFAKQNRTLKESIFGLGIVTGNNSKILSTVQKNSNALPIFTGKEVKKYKLSNPVYFFDYKKENLQQAAKEEIYLAKEKLVYKFISKKLVFAYDNKQRFVLNSANILIPTIA